MLGRGSRFPPLPHGSIDFGPHHPQVLRRDRVDVFRPQSKGFPQKQKSLVIN
jgi:hypothetical protein